jgi:hypothetical protein
MGPGDVQQSGQVVIEVAPYCARDLHHLRLECVPPRTGTDCQTSLKLKSAEALYVFLFEDIDIFARN